MSVFEKASDIRVGIVGYGGAFNMGRRHVSGIRAAGMTPLAVADVDAKRLRIAELDYPGIETYESANLMLKNADVNLIVIVTPHNTHSALSKQCLNAGRHVVVEKPLATTTADCDSMIKTAEKNNLVLSAFHNRHWDGCVLRAVKKIQSGIIGDIVRVEAHMGSWHQPANWWRSSKSISGGILYDWGVHLLEYSLQIIDAEIVEVTGFAFEGFWGKKLSWKDDTNEDEAMAVVRFENGVPLFLRISSIDVNPKEGMIEVTGTKGSYIFDGKNWVQITAKNTSKMRESGENPESDWGSYYRNLIDYFVNDAELIISAEWSRRPIHIIDLAVKSAQQGKSLKAKYS